MASRSADNGFRSLPAESVESFDAWDVQDRIADTICAVLNDAGIEVVRLSRSGQEWLAVDARQQVPAIAALQRSAACRAWVVEDRVGARPQRVASLGTGPQARDLLLYRHLRSPDGHYVSGREAGVFLQFWQATGRTTKRPDGGRFEPGTRLPPSRNRVAPYLAPAQWTAAQSRPDRRLPAQDRRNLLEFSEPVDAVYTWVDDSDPAWQERREAVDPDRRGLASDALDPARTRDRDEFRYSLRSLSMYAGWIRRVWIVTDGQVPSWLDVDHQHVEVITHREIFSDPSRLPVFNSHAIESQLQHIPGLSEHFLYLNDDFFFGRPVRPELFFHGNGLPKMMTSLIAIDLDLDTDSRNGAMLAARKGRDWIEHTFGRTVTHRLQHVPHAHLKSALQDLEVAMPDDFDRIARSSFRHRDDLSIPSDLGHYYSYATQRTVTGRLAFQYVDLDSPLAAEHLQALLRERHADCFCVNDVGGYPEPGDTDRFRRFLAEYFPIPSPFERTVR